MQIANKLPSFAFNRRNEQQTGKQKFRSLNVARRSAAAAAAATNKAAAVATTSDSGDRHLLSPSSPSRFSGDSPIALSVAAARQLPRWQPRRPPRWIVGAFGLQRVSKRAAAAAAYARARAHSRPLALIGIGRRRQFARRPSLILRRLDYAAASIKVRWCKLQGARPNTSSQRR